MSRDPPDRPVYVGNFEYDAEERDIKKLMEKYGDVIRIDMKQGFAFCYYAREEDGDYAIRKLDGTEWGYKRRKLRLEWAKQRDAERKRETRPNTTLFVVNFDTVRTRTSDVERAFEPFGRLKRVEIKKNFAFVEYDSLDDAQYALKKMNGAQLGGRTITVEYVANVDGGRNSAQPAAAAGAAAPAAARARPAAAGAPRAAATAAAGARPGAAHPAAPHPLRAAALHHPAHAHARQWAVRAAAATAAEYAVHVTCRESLLGF
eukprot:CAMPEP_0202862442 /NCGR_PEP_ID=MMETSP1391-20130828/3482_1 /ASSEMBLY_ACC=CAM_ASM_000867 /TAXON_ID=1034604 /ORGANISM="Chlamydomonas leiostraca, Strain SAG 11-49" /LENGTH=260 /DNA_ID=CAMNT_0049541981 /DNA_START=18 /DNA_END=801 /DNA_ORIENTATION=+